MTAAAPETPGTPPSGPGARVIRTAGQGGGTLVLIDLWQSFGWFGSAHWTPAQASSRWPAITATVWLAIATAHNAANWWSTTHPTIPKG